LGFSPVAGRHQGQLVHWGFRTQQRILSFATTQNVPRRRVVHEMQCNEEKRKYEQKSNIIALDSTKIKNKKDKYSIQME
jgi:hypothetical protein